MQYSVLLWGMSKCQGSKVDLLYSSSEPPKLQQKLITKFINIVGVQEEKMQKVTFCVTQIFAV